MFRLALGARRAGRHGGTGPVQVQPHGGGGRGEGFRDYSALAPVAVEPPSSSRSGSGFRPGCYLCLL